MVIKYYNGKCDYSDLMSLCKINENYKNKIIIKYIYYYLLFKKDDIEKTYEKGACNKSLDVDNFNKMKLPILCIELQNKIVRELDLLNENNNNIKKIIEDNKEIMKIYLNLKINNINDKQLLNDCCEIQNGKRIVKNQVETGIYPVYGGGGLTSFYTNEYNREGKTCKISREGMSLHNCVLILNEKYYLNSQALTIISKIQFLINEYLWYYLELNKEIIFDLGRGTAQKAIDIDNFKLLEIPIPSEELQEEIINYCNELNKVINKLEKQYDNNNILINDILNNYIN
jgi:restriction endonuclease S subunit